MESALDEFDGEPAIRPTLLTVLCILTFIGSGWAIATNLWAYTTAAESAKVISYMGHRTVADSINRKDSLIYKIGEKKKSAFGEKMMMSVSKMFNEETIKNNAIGGIISAIFTLVGAILMWRLNKIGFYIYIAGVLIGLIIPFYLYGNNIIAVGISAFSGFFGLVFIALYALNLRSFRK